MALVNQWTTPVSRSQTWSCRKKTFHLQICSCVLRWMQMRWTWTRKKKLGINAEDGTFHFHGSALSYSYLGTGDMNDGGASWRSLCPSPAFNTKQSFGFVQFIPLSFIFRIGHFNLQWNLQSIDLCIYHIHYNTYTRNLVCRLNISLDRGGNKRWNCWCRAETGPN